MRQFLTTKYALPAIIAVGILLLVAIVKLQPAMEHNLKARPSIPVNYIEVRQQQLRPEIVGYGTVKPDVNLQAKAEVTGRITYINPNLKKGEIFPADTLLLTIDDKDYQLALKQAEADLLANKANLKEMELTIENNELEVKLAQEKLKVRNKEYQRLAKLRKTGSISQSKLDAERQNLLAQQQEVQQLKNKQTTLPSDLEVMKAQLAISEAKLQRNQRDLERTEIRLPFNGRISEVFIEMDQYVATGTQLFDASGLDKVVINAQFPMDQFSLFARGFKRDKIQVANMQNFANMTEVLASLGLTAKVNLASGEFNAWQAKVERFSDNLDPQSRTIGVTVSVSGNYQNIEPGTKPPLLEDMYMQVSLLGAPQEFMVVPRFAIHQNQVFRISKESTLEKVSLGVTQMQGNLALIKNSLANGDKIVTSDVFPAVTGMDLAPVEDIKTQQQIGDWLGGEK